MNETSNEAKCSSKRFNKDVSPSSFSLLGTAGVMGMHMVSGPLVGGGLGWLLDAWLSTGRICTGIGALLGFAAGFLNVWTDAKFLICGNESADRERKNCGTASKQGERTSEDGGTTYPETPMSRQNRRSSESHASVAGNIGPSVQSEPKGDDGEALRLASLLAGTSFTNTERN